MEPTPQSLEQADRVDLVYAYVLSQIGAKTTAEVLSLWQDVPAGQAAQTAGAWLKRAVDLILTRRWQARSLGIAYYRLVRALRTGHVVANPLAKEEEPEQISLEMLRQEFEALVAQVTGEGSTEVSKDFTPDDEDDAITVERIDDLNTALEADEKSAEPYTRTLLEDMAEAASAKAQAMPDDTPVSDARAQVRELHVQHGAMIAGAASRVAMNGARNATNQASVRDIRVIGWVRQHGKSDAPCYFCSMLMSRRVLYSSKQSAGQGRATAESGRVFVGSGMAKFHDNCHCTVEALYSDQSFGTHPKYAQNRYYADLWDRHIKDKFSGDDAVNEWRKLLARIRANENKPAAQAAA